MKSNLITIIYPDEARFNLVIESDISVDSLLERLFAEWNAGSGTESQDFLVEKIRSLSVNDIIEINGAYFQCASYGWNEVSQKYVDDLEEEVADHPKRANKEFSCWWILDEIMYNRRMSGSATVPRITSNHNKPPSTP